MGLHLVQHRVGVLPLSQVGEVVLDSVIHPTAHVRTVSRGNPPPACAGAGTMSRWCHPRLRGCGTVSRWCHPRLRGCGTILP
jgi:hypothetical protein